MPDDLRRAHEKNDETLERIYIGRRFKNDTERLEKLFDLYTKMTASTGEPKPLRARRRKNPRRLMNTVSLPSVSLNYCPHRRLDQGQRARHARHAGARL